MDDRNILKLLKEKADSESLAKFAKKIFMYEFNEYGNWKKEYDKVLDDIIKNEVDK